MPSIINIVKGALVALPALSQAAGQLGFSLGYNKGPQWDGVTAPKDCKTEQDFLLDMKAIEDNTGSNIVRLYTMVDCDLLGKALPAIKKAGGKAMLGIWAYPNTHFLKELALLKKYMPTYADIIIGITVGSEVLYREEETPEELAKQILATKKAVADAGLSIPVGFADTWNLLIEDRANVAIEASDLILANAFSYWQGQTAQNATKSFVDDVMQALAHVQKVKGDKDFIFWVGETNWPTDGADFEGAKPSLETAAAFYKDAICGILNWGINVFVFEAFDEQHKETEKENDVEKYWGVMYENRKPKYDLTCP